MSRQRLLRLCGLLLVILTAGSVTVPGRLGAGLARSTQETPLVGPLVVTNRLDDAGFLIVDMETGQERELVFGPGRHLFGGFSPDGCQIIFTWEAAPGKADLYAARLGGSGLRQMTFVGRTGALSYRAWEPDWSPDGERVVFTFVRYYNPPDEDPYRTMHIAWVPRTGGTPILYSNSGLEFQPRWSPDGEWLVYVSDQPVIEADDPATLDPATTDPADRRPEIWVGRINGSGKRRLVGFTDGGAHTPSWSPDGELIAFLYEPLGNLHHLMITSRDGAVTPFIVNRQAAMTLAYTWQPTGRHLLAVMRGLGGQDANTLWRLPSTANGDNQAETFVEQPYLDYPRFSADGRWLAMRQAYELAVYDTATGQLTTYGPPTLNNSPPVWSPGGFAGEAACES